jgi:hypothetical protein
MKANEIVERFKKILLSTDVQEETPEVEEKVELTEDVKDIEVEAGYHDDDMGGHKDDEDKKMKEHKDEEEKEDKMEKYATKEDLAKVVAELKGMIKEIDMKEHKDKEVPEKLSAQEPVVEPISHDPEAQVSKRPINVLSGNRSRTTQDIVYNKLFNK